VLERGTVSLEYGSSRRCLGLGKGVDEREEAVMVSGSRGQIRREAYTMTGYVYGC
jgi:hypothetical protein